MYAVIATSGRQYRVAEGDTIVVDRLSQEPGETVQFERVLLVRDDAVRVGTPLVDGAEVTGEVIDHSRGPKVLNFRMNRRHRFRKLKGSRAHLTTVRITGIQS